ncbi:MAG: hypothetical protein M5U27_12480 [Gaiella sp.]|nr:hypothetical protein [Gaiella sp.]
MRERALAIVAFTAIVGGGILWLLDEPGWADTVWGAGAVAVLVPLTLDTFRSLVRGDVGVDAIALVAIAGALVLGEQLAGAIVALMMSGAERSKPGRRGGRAGSCTCSSSERRGSRTGTATRGSRRCR